MKKFIEWCKKVFGIVALDGLVHIETCALIVILCPRCFGSWSIFVAFVAGVLKEVYDIVVKKSKPSLSVKDLICDFVGIVIGYLIFLCY